nr:hypothetical protein [Tissierella sp.]
MQNKIFYILTIVLLIVSFSKDKTKTKMALKKAWKSFENILPQMLGILTSVGLIIAFLNPELISKIIGSNSGYLGVALAAVVGSITLIPGFIAFPTAAILLQNGAGYMQIGAFISSLIMVGLLTIPVEIKFFGKRSTLMRNGMAFMFSFVVALVIGKVVG